MQPERTDEHILMPLRARDGSVRAHALIDVEDVRLTERRWFLTSRGYVVRNGIRGGGTWPEGRLVWLHREVLGLVHGDGLEGDHWNGDRLDCRRANLRVVTHAQNGQNVRPRGGGTSRHRGVSWHPRRGRWQARGTINGRTVYLGLFDSEFEAAEVARSWRLANMPFVNEDRAEGLWSSA